MSVFASTLTLYYVFLSHYDHEQLHGEEPDHASIIFRHEKTSSIMREYNTTVFGNNLVLHGNMPHPLEEFHVLMASGHESDGELELEWLVYIKQKRFIRCVLL